MAISSLNLEAFLAVAREHGFSKAAKSLHITQSALSQRVRQLEDQLNTTLIIRDRAGLKLTQVGEKLFRMGNQCELLEEQFLLSLEQKDKNALVGVVRIAAYSSVLRSIVIPALSSIASQHSGVRFEFLTAEVGEIPEMLHRSQVDFAITDHQLIKQELKSERLGSESYIAISPQVKSRNVEVFLDTDSRDKTTDWFFKGQSKVPEYRREFMGDTYSILHGVIRGYGSAVVPKHLLTSDMKVKVLKRFKAMDMGVFLNYHTQVYYSDLHLEVVKNLKTYSSKLLKPSTR